MSFEKNLESLRKQKGWSQDDLADKLNLTRQAVSKWETGSSKPDIDNVKNISQLFSVRIDDLLNNEVVEDKAVSLNFEKKEKRENIIKTIKFAIIALVIVYLITVIYKFASLLIIVNGVQKYANLNNYHYVITTYDENGLKEKEECWFKDGVSKTVNTVYLSDKNSEFITCINFNNKVGYIENEDKKENFNVDNYIIGNGDFSKGEQFFSRLPIEIKKSNIMNLLLSSIKIQTIKINNTEIFISTDNKFISIDDDSLLPVMMHLTDLANNSMISKKYDIEIGSVEDLII